MTTPTPVRLHHIALTVTDLQASIRWYEQVFGVRRQMDAPHDGGTAEILADDTWTLMFALHRHDANRGELFDETRTGLDHVGFAVSTRADLQQWQDHLERHAVVRADRTGKPLTQSPIADEPYGSVLVFRDPDNNQLELFAPPTH